MRTPGRLLPDDDFMSNDASALWGSAGRRDLSIIKSLGANTVRLYGNDPALDHTAFLNEAEQQGLHVIAGISDYPYTQMHGNCLHTDFDCYEQIKAQYAQNLERGFLAKDGSYHPALHTVILMNEPDLKFVGPPRGFKKALISAFDAVLDAEKEAGAKGASPNFTVTFSFGVCPKCAKFGHSPGLGQMLELREAMQNPQSVGYQPRNDIWTTYKVRFTNSVNTANPSTDIPRLFLDTYDALFQGTPVFIGEYHDPHVHDQKQDLEGILELAADESTLLTGIAFFEFQVRYDKGGSEMGFGMFGLSDGDAIVDFNLKWSTFTAWCLTPVEATTPDLYVHTAVAKAFGGPGIGDEHLCPRSSVKLATEAEENEEDRDNTDNSVIEAPGSIAAGAHWVPMTWVGCFEDSGTEQGGMSTASGHDTNSCAMACQANAYIMLKDGGECHCTDRRPATPFFRQVQHEACGGVCDGEEGLAPTRYCGGPSASAVYSIYSAAAYRAPVEGSMAEASFTGGASEDDEVAALKYLLAHHPEMELGTGAASLLLANELRQRRGEHQAQALRGAAGVETVRAAA